MKQSKARRLKKGKSSFKNRGSEQNAYSTFSPRNTNRTPFDTGRRYRTNSEKSDLEDYDTRRSPVRLSKKSHAIRSRPFEREYSPGTSSLRDDFWSRDVSPVTPRMRSFCDSPSYRYDLMSPRKRRYSESPEPDEYLHRMQTVTKTSRMSPFYDRENVFAERDNRMHPMETGHYSLGRRENNRMTNHATQRRNELKAQNVPMICKFYNNEGNCDKGNSCTFVHLCKHFVEGDCRYGIRCKRSHCVFDDQPRSALKTCGIIGLPENEIIKKLKEVLGTNGNPSKTAIRPLTAIWMNPLSKPRDRDRTNNFFDVSSDEKFSDDDKSSAEDNKNDDSPRDFIPLEETQRQSRRKKNSHKVNKTANTIQREDTGTQVEENDVKKECLTSLTNPEQLIVTIEGQDVKKRFQIRKVDEAWQVSSEHGAWNDVDASDSEEFNRLVSICQSINEKVHSSE